MFLVVLAEVQTDELAVPFEGDVVMHSGLTEDVPRIFCSTKENSNIQGEKKEGFFRMNVVTRSLARRSKGGKVMQKRSA